MKAVAVVVSSPNRFPRVYINRMVAMKLPPRNSTIPVDTGYFMNAGQVIETKDYFP